MTKFFGILSYYREFINKSLAKLNTLVNTKNRHYHATSPCPHPFSINHFLSTNWFHLNRFPLAVNCRFIAFSNWIIASRRIRYPQLNSLLHPMTSHNKYTTTTTATANIRIYSNSRYRIMQHLLPLARHSKPVFLVLNPHPAVPWPGPVLGYSSGEKRIRKRPAQTIILPLHKDPWSSLYLLPPCR